MPYSNRTAMRAEQFIRLAKGLGASRAFIAYSEWFVGLPMADWPGDVWANYNAARRCLDEAQRLVQQIREGREGDEPTEEVESAE